jgi:hypothetical protein
VGIEVGGQAEPQETKTSIESVAACGHVDAEGCLGLSCCLCFCLCLCLWSWSWLVRRALALKRSSVGRRAAV